jgi:hypothetical protein
MNVEPVNTERTASSASLEKETYLLVLKFEKSEISLDFLNTGAAV